LKTKLKLKNISETKLKLNNIKSKRKSHWAEDGRGSVETMLSAGRNG